MKDFLQGLFDAEECMSKKLKQISLKYKKTMREHEVEEICFLSELQDRLNTLFADAEVEPLPETFAPDLTANFLIAKVIINQHAESLVCVRWDDIKCIDMDWYARGFLRRYEAYCLGEGDFE